MLLRQHDGEGLSPPLDATRLVAHKPVRAGLEAGLPLRLQRLADTCLVAPVMITGMPSGLFLVLSWAFG